MGDGEGDRKFQLQITDSYEFGRDIHLELADMIHLASGPLQTQSFSFLSFLSS
jgi:hypothetical protein